MAVIFILQFNNRKVPIEPYFWIARQRTPSFLLVKAKLNDGEASSNKNNDTRSELLMKTLIINKNFPTKNYRSCKMSSNSSKISINNKAYLRLMIISTTKIKISSDSYRRNQCLVTRHASFSKIDITCNKILIIRPVLESTWNFRRKTW